MAVAAALLALLLSGCEIGLGAGEQTGSAQLTVTTDFGRELILEQDEVSLTESDQVMRVLERHAEIETRYGGGFVHSINGLTGGTREGRPVDWFYYVNGIDADRGATDWSLEQGDRIWWDYRDWGAAMRVPAVIGQYPAPFSQDGAAIRCETEAEQCRELERRLEQDGIELKPATAEVEPVPLLVGPWDRIAEQPGARLIERGSQVSGVFVEIEQQGADPVLVALDERGETALEFDSATGLIAATRQGNQPSQWVITGASEAAVANAVAAFTAENLTRRFAVMAGPEQVTELPLP